MCLRRHTADDVEEAIDEPFKVYGKGAATDGLRQVIEKRSSDWRTAVENNQAQKPIGKALACDRREQKPVLGIRGLAVRKWAGRVGQVTSRLRYGNPR